MASATLFFQSTRQILGNAYSMRATDQAQQSGKQPVARSAGRGRHAGIRVSAATTHAAKERGVRVTGNLDLVVTSRGGCYLNQVIDKKWVAKELKRLDAQIRELKDVLDEIEEIDPRTPQVRKWIASRKQLIKGLKLEKGFVNGSLK